MAPSPGREAPSEFGPAELGRIVGTVLASFVFPALKGRAVVAGCGRPNTDLAPLLDVRAEHCLAPPGKVLGVRSDRRLAVRFWIELFLEPLERM